MSTGATNVAAICTSTGASSRARSRLCMLTSSSSFAALYQYMYSSRPADADAAAALFMPFMSILPDTCTAARTCCHTVHQGRAATNAPLVKTQYIVRFMHVAQRVVSKKKHEINVVVHVMREAKGKLQVDQDERAGLPRAVYYVARVCIAVQLT